MSRLLPLALLLASSCIIRVSVDHDTQTLLLDEDVSAIEVTDAAGDVTIRGADRADVRVDAALTWYDDRPDVDWYVDGDTLVIDVDCRDADWLCEADLVIDVPRAFAVTVDGATGDLGVHDVFGVVRLDTANGDVTIADLSGDTSVATANGDVLGRRLDSDRIDVDVSNGSIDLVHAGVFSLIDARTSHGDVTLLVPAGTYDIDADVDWGDVDIFGVTVDEDAPSRIVARTATGDIAITGYSVVTDP